MASIIGKDPKEKAVNLTETEWVEHSQGLKDVIETARNILRKAEKKVYINSDFPISELYDDLQLLVDKNVEIYVFGFYELGRLPLGINVFSHEHKMKIDHVCTRLLIAIDEKEVFMAESYGNKAEWRGTRTNNELMAKIVCEHIHNDIYLLLIREKTGRDLYDEVDMHSKMARKRWL
jgi:hypothetical protein